MGNCLPCLADGAKITKASDATKHRPHISDLSLKKKLWKSKKMKHGHHAPTIEGTSAQALQDHFMHPIIPSYPVEGEKGFIRVKVVLTKKEAAQLLSKCVGGEQKMMEYLANELERMEGRRPELGLESRRGAWRSVLETIPGAC